MNDDTSRAADPWRSESIELLADALAKAQAEIEIAPRSGDNAFKGYSYSTIADIRRACQGPLAKHGLSVAQLPSTSEDGSAIILRTVLMHTSGQWLSSTMQARCEGTDRAKAGVMDMQKVGSALTYMRKYALAAITGVAPDDEDDDGQATAGRDREPERRGGEPQRRPKQQQRPRGDRRQEQAPRHKAEETWAQFVSRTCDERRRRWHEAMKRARVPQADVHRPENQLPERDQVTQHVCSRALEAGTFAFEAIAKDDKPDARDPRKVWDAVSWLYDKRPLKARASVNAYLDTKERELRVRLGMDDLEDEPAGEPAAEAREAALAN